MAHGPSSQRDSDDAFADDAPRTLVVGIGSPHGDDQAGWRVIERLAQLAGESRSSVDAVVRRATTPSDLLDWLPVRERLVIVDACCGEGSGVGSEGWRRFDSWGEAERSARSATGHLIGLVAVLELARTLDRLPPRVELWGVRGERFEPGVEPSGSVENACESLARRLAATLEAGPNGET